jgi:hypothetical protein
MSRKFPFGRSMITIMEVVTLMELIEGFQGGGF